MSIKIEDLVKYGNIGYYQFFKATMLVLLIDEKPINYFTCFEFSQNYKHEQKFKYLTKSPCTIRKGIQLCIGEIIISIDKFNLIWNDCITKKEYSIENNSVILDSTFETDARFVPAIDPTTGQYNMFIPIEKHLFGSDFIGNYYLFELFSENKQLSILSNKDIDKIQIEIQKIALIYKLNILTDHIGGLVCKFPIEIVKHHPILLNRQQGIRINFDKDQRVGEERRFLLTFMQEFDQCICYNKTVENFDFKEMSIRPNQLINKITIIDSQSELTVFALYLDYTLKVGYDRDIQPPLITANGYSETRKILLNGKIEEIELNFVARAGEVYEFIDTGRTNKRIEKEKQQFYYDHHILRSYSYYLVYHYLNSSGGPNRSLGIDRLTFNGTMMSVAPTLDGSVTPALPAFYATGLDEDKFETANEFTLSNTAAPANFTAEYNVSGVGTSTYVFSYIDANNYIDVTVDLTAKTVKLNKTENGMTMEIGAGTLVNDFAADKLHTIRVAARDGVVDVVFDNMTKIDDASLATVEGKIGYKSLAAEATIGYTAYSNVAMGMSDQREAKQATGFVGAADYLYDDTYAVSAKLSEGAIHTITSDDDSRLNGWKALTLKASGDQASYLVYNKTTGRYGLELVYRNSDGGKKIGVKVDGVDGGTVYRCTLPTIESDDMYVKAVVGEFDLKAGARIIRLENVGSEIDFAAFTFVETSSVAPVYENALSGYAQKGADYKTIWKIKEGGHYAKAGTRQLVYFGDNTITDFTLEVEIMLEGASGTSNAGIVFHAQNYAASSHDDYRSIQGYYVALSNNSVLLERYCYADSSQQLAAYAKGAETVTSDTFHKLKIEARGNVYTISLDGEQIFKVTDGWGFASGKVGLYTYGAAVVFKNLKISG